MRLLYVADGRSPTALNWMRHFVEGGHEVHLLSTFACRPNLDVASLTVLPVAFSGAARFTSPPAGEQDRGSILGDARWIRLRTWIRHWLGPLTLARTATEAGRVFTSLKPDLIHAMRIPYEGMLAAAADPPAPLVVSVWGNDFTLHAPSTPLMARHTRRALARADALHADCRRDEKLAHRWGFAQDRPSIVLPGGGGIRREVFHPAATHVQAWSGSLASLSGVVAADVPVVVNPRGFRRYVRSDTFFRAVPRILESHPSAVFLCPTMKGERQAVRWLARLGIGHAVHLLPRLPQDEMAMVYQRAQVTVSVSEHDGTPNTLLEALACGCFPVAGDLESIREWIEPGENGLLVDPGDPEALAGAVSRALSDPALRDHAREHNRDLIDRRAAYKNVMVEAAEFYHSVMDQSAR